MLLFLNPRAAGQNAASSQPLSVSIAVGTDRNYYPRFCAALSDVARQTGTRLQVTCNATQGSIDNIYAMTHGTTDFAVIQGDIAHRVWNKDAPFVEESPRSSIRLISPLFTEKVHILVRPHQYLASIGSLRNKRIWVGPENSGSRIAAMNLLAAAGLADGFRIVDTMSARQALALLGSKLHNGPQLDVAIDALPQSVDALNNVLLRLGIKSNELALPDSQERVAVLFRPDLAVANLADLRDKKIWIDHGVPAKAAGILLAAGFAKPISGNIHEALAQLINHQADAIVEPGSLEPEVVTAVFDAGRYRLIPFARDPRTNGKTMLVAMLRPDLNGFSIPPSSDLRIWWPEGDATLDQVVLERLLGTSGTDADRQRLMLGRRLGGSSAMKLLELGELDAVFQSTVARNPIVYDLMKDSEVSLLGLDWPAVESLEKDGSYVETSLQKNVYPELDHGVFTAGIQTFLVTRLGDTPEDQAKVSAVARLLSEQQPAIEEGITKRDPDYINGNHSLAPFRLILVGSPIKDYLVKQGRVHPAASEFLIRPGHLRSKTINLLWILTVTIVVVGGTAIFLERKQWLARYHRTGILVTLAFVLFWALAAVWLQALEGDVTQDYSSLSGSAVSFAKTVASHFKLPIQGPTPTTRAGQTALDIFSWLGVFLVATFLLPLRAQISTVILWLLGRKKDQNPSAGNAS